MLLYPPERKLYKFQEELITAMLQSESKDIYNACDMGLGKTCQAIVYANTVVAKNILVVCPASLRLNWVKEFRMWYTHTFNPLVIQSGKDFDTLSQTNRFAKFNPIIVSYDLLVASKKAHSYICSKKWDMMILDEAHYIRNSTSRRSRYIQSIWNNFDRVMCLSGTPMMNSLTDFWMPLHNILSRHPSLHGEDADIIKYKTHFNKEFLVFIKTKFGEKPVATKNIDRLKNILKRRYNFYFRKTKEQALPDLPEKTLEVVSFDFKTNLEQFKTEGVMNFLSLLEHKDNPKATDPHLAAMMSALGAAKSDHPEIIEYIKEFLDAGESVVIFAYHTQAINNLMENLKMYDPVKLVGSTSMKDRQKAVEDFQAGKTKLFIGNIISAGQGITLTAARICIFLEVTWLPSYITQAVDRLCRIGQKNAVIGYFLSTNDDTDKFIMQMMIKKQKAINLINKD